MNFAKKNVLITGASKSIGADIARVLAGYGLKVWINYRSKPELAEALQSEILNAGGKAAIIKFDATNEADFIAAIATIMQADGELGYLVNNAGIVNDKLALRMKIDDFTGVLEANLTSAFIGCREALKTMSKARAGAVVNIASIVGERGNLGQTNYAASKGGMIAMTKSFALEGAARGVRYNAITPGFIETDMTSTLDPEIKAAYVKSIPLGRLGQGREIAQATAFLLSDEASYITGEILKVNGGMYM